MKYLHKLEVVGFFGVLGSVALFFILLLLGVPGRPWAFVPLAPLIIFGACLLIGQQIRVRKYWRNND